MNGTGFVFDHGGKVPTSVYTKADDSFSSPLEEAVYRNDETKFKAAVKEGHLVTIELKIGRMSCVEYAAMMGYVNILRALFEHSMNAVVLRNYFDAADIVEQAYMISENKDIFFDYLALAEANRYEAALFTAVEYDQSRCVELILSVLGCRNCRRRRPFLLKPNDDSRTCVNVLELALARGHEECATILEFLSKDTLSITPLF